MSKLVLRYKIDLVSLVAVFGALLFQLLAFFQHWRWYWFLLMLPLVRWVSLVQHNHVHLGIFKSPALNEAFGWLCFLSAGSPHEFYRIHHVRNHHRFNQRFSAEEQDWSSTFGFSGTHFPDKPVGVFYYVLTFPLIAICCCLLEVLRSPGSKTFRRMFLSVSLMFPVGVAMWLINWEGFVFFFVIPWLVVIFALGYNNYLHHIGCGMKDPYDSANESLSAIGTIFGFNAGYHIEHHLRPGLHWSKLPQFHRQINPLITLKRYGGEELKTNQESTLSGKIMLD